MEDTTKSTRVPGFHVVNPFRRKHGHMEKVLLAISLGMQYLVHEHSFVAENYAEALERWTDSEYYDKHCRHIQLPFNPVRQYFLSLHGASGKGVQKVLLFQMPGAMGSSGIGKMDYCLNIVKRVEEAIAKRKQERVGILCAYLFFYMPR